MVVGAQAGDEGKGAVTDYLSKEAEVIARFQGGPNAGHTIVNGSQILKFHQIPSGINRRKTCILGPGMVIDLETLVEELAQVAKAKLPLDCIYISNQAHLILPNDVAETKKNNASSGTCKGVAPAYSHMALRTGIRMIDFKRAVNGDPIDSNDPRADRLKSLIPYFLSHKALAHYVGNTGEILRDAIERGANVLFEGAQGISLGPAGEYPFTTSSSPGIGGVGDGAEIDPRKIDRVIGVAKAYLTRVDKDDKGPLVTAMSESDQERLRILGNEWGATTGRPRRIGYLDLVQLRNSIRTGIDELALTKIDLLDGEKDIYLCNAYELNGETTFDYPRDAYQLRQARPVNIRLPGWRQSTKGIREYDKLPEETKQFISEIEKLAARPVTIIKTGADTKEIIIRKSPWRKAA